LLVKDAANPYPDATRPINLTQLLRRYFEKLLHRKWIQSAPPWIKLHAYQAGFRKGYSTLSHLLLSDELSRSKFPISVFLDLKAAYDSVPWHRLLQCLSDKGCPSHDMALISTLLCRPASLYVSVNRVASQVPISTQRGLFQGSILSPLLFTIFIDSLAALTNVSPCRSRALFFADDINLKAVDATEAQRLVDVCDVWAKENGMCWGLAKCGVVGTAVAMHLDGQVIPRCATYKYLGVPHGSTRVCWEQLFASACARHDALLLVSEHQSANWHPLARLVIWRTFCRPILEYALPIAATWFRRNAKFPDGKQCYSVLLASYKRAMCFIGHTTRYLSVIENLTGLGSLDDRLNYLMGGFCGHLRRLSGDNPVKDLPRLSSSRHYVYGFCLVNPTYQSYEFAQSRIGPHLSFRSWGRQRLLESLNHRSGAMDVLMNPHHRSATSFYDLLFTQPLSLAQPALRWRINRAFIGRKCCLCHQPFTRRHVMQCGLLATHLTLPLLTTDYLYPYDQHRVYLRAQHHGLPAQPIYTPLDFALNYHQYEDFYLLYSHISSTLPLPPP
jgi:hypothetical protein